MSLVNDLLRDLEDRQHVPADVETLMTGAERRAATGAGFRLVLLFAVAALAVGSGWWFLKPNSELRLISSAEAKVVPIPGNDGIPKNSLQVVEEVEQTQTFGEPADATVMAKPLPLFNPSTQVVAKESTASSADKTDIKIDKERTRIDSLLRRRPSPLPLTN